MARKRGPESDSLGLRNGLKLRDGQPRWEPSPTNRQLGIKGRDLKDLSGRWIEDRGLLVSLSDARMEFAKLYRRALHAGAAGAEARDKIRLILAKLQPPTSEDGRLRRANVIDLIEKCAALVEGRPEEETDVASAGGITTEMLVDAYLAAAEQGGTTLNEDGEEIPIDIKLATLRQYRSQLRKLKARFPKKDIATYKPGNMKAWYEQMVRDISADTANVAIGAAGAAFRWAVWKGWITLAQFPVQKIGRKKAQGRRVYLKLALETEFEAWCDANGFSDVADALVGCCWTGARQVDLCKAYTHQLLNSWAYVPQKTEKRGIEAMPGIMPRFRQRIEARIERSRDDGRTYLPNAVPYLFDVENGRPHTSQSIGDRFRKARRKAADANPDLFAPLLKIRLQDTRDTCVTRLFMAGIPIAKIAPWTGHSHKSAEDILREHYRVIREEEALETARQFETYAAVNSLLL